MEYVDEFRDPALARSVAARIRARLTTPRILMEICGGQTHAILRYGLEELLGPALTLVHGPDCPVCVTPLVLIDHAVALARTPGVTLCTFGDMLRVPGSEGTLDAARAAGGDVRMVYSPLDAVRIAADEPTREVVLFAVGFETTAPTHAAAVLAAARAGLANFMVLAALVCVPPALEQLLGMPDCRIEGVLAAGHVCTVMGTAEYHALAARHRVPIVVTGFEPLDILTGIERCLVQLDAGRAVVENAYDRAVRDDGNAAARQAVATVFEVADREWRGLGVLPDSGLALRAAYRQYDATQRYPSRHAPAAEPAACIAGAILAGQRRPHECSAFGTACTPAHPLGAPMVSGEGACAAYFRYRGRPRAAGLTPAAQAD
ncbi:MAG: hydrogenase formation protein HypD [Gammaproteobacteria bacterium]